MEWLWIIPVAALAFYVGRQSRSTAPSVDQSRSDTALASSRILLFETLRRELANYLVRRNPDAFVSTYRKARSAETQIENADIEFRDAMFTLITKQYANYEDFDLVATRPYVLYPDGLSWHSDEAVVDHFIMLVKFHSLQRASKEWPYAQPATSEKEFEHLRGYVQKIKDTRFEQRLKDAVEEFFQNRKGDLLSADVSQPAYETARLAAYYAPGGPDNRYAFHFKDTDEYGLYSSFVSDKDKHYKGHYRTDPSFKETKTLDTLRIDERI